MSQSPAAKTESKIYRFVTITNLFWIAIIIGILGISLFAGFVAEGWISLTPSTSQPVPAPSTESFSKTAMVWKILAQQVQQTEDKTLQMLANTLEKLPNLAPLPRPNMPAAANIPVVVEIATSSPIAWKLLNEQLAVTEQQQVMMLQHFLDKAAEKPNSSN